MCWKCGNDEKYDMEESNGMCYNCFTQCKEAMEAEMRAQHEDAGEWQDGEPH